MTQLIPCLGYYIQGEQSGCQSLSSPQLSFVANLFLSDLENFENETFDLDNTCGKLNNL